MPKKPPPPPFVVKVLTTEYLIEGTIAGDTWLHFFKADELGDRLPMTSVQIQATGAADIPPRACARFMALAGNVIAYVPQTEISQLAQYDIWKMYKHPNPGIFYIGPYVMRGTLMSLQQQYLSQEAAIFDVHITSAVAGARWGGLQAPYALLHLRWLHGYEPG